MKHRFKPHVYFVGVDTKTWGVVRHACEQIGTKVSRFASIEDCLELLHTRRCDLIIIEIEMSNADVLDLLREVKNTLPCLPILVVTACGNVQVAITAMKMGAFNIVEKPLSTSRILSEIGSVMEGLTLPSPLPTGQRLTPAEKKVLCVILYGKSNREAAAILHCSIKTIEVHRSHIMSKFDVDNIVDLMKQVFAMGLTNWPSINYTLTPH